MKEIIGLTLPIIGVIIGLLWGEVSRWFADRRQKRQTINTVISLLLELYFQIKRISVITQQSNSSITELFAAIKGKELTQQDEKETRNILSKTLYPIIAETVSDDLSKISSDYDNLLKELSCYYPIDSYRLRGRNNIIDILAKIDTYHKKITEQCPISYDEYNVIVADIKPIIQSQTLQDELSVIKEEIEKLSKDLRCHERKEIAETLKYLDDNNTEDIRQNLESIKPIIIKQLRESNLI